MTRKRRYFMGQPKKAGSMTETDGNDIDVQFPILVADRKYDEALALLPQVKDVNVLHPEHNATALHTAAARQAMSFIKAFIDARGEDIDFQMKDGYGRLASDLAWNHARNEELGAWLMDKEREYAQKHNSPLFKAP